MEVKRDSATDHAKVDLLISLCITYYLDDQGETGEQEYQAEDADNDDGSKKLVTTESLFVGY